MKVLARQFLTETPDGDAVCVDVRLVLTPAEEADLLASYDPNSATSPSASVMRPLVRAILDKIKEVRGV